MQQFAFQNDEVFHLAVTLFDYFSEEKLSSIIHSNNINYVLHSHLHRFRYDLVSDISSYDIFDFE